MAVVLRQRILGRDAVGHVLPQAPRGRAGGRDQSGEVDVPNATLQVVLTPTNLALRRAARRWRTRASPRHAPVPVYNGLKKETLKRTDRT
jgi:hypothetical protein